MRQVMLFLSAGALALTTQVAAAQSSNRLADGQVIALWSDAAPGATGTDASDVPAMTVYLARPVPGGTPAVIVCPGSAIP